MRVRSSRLLLVTVAASLALTACSSSDDGGDDAATDDAPTEAATDGSDGSDGSEAPSDEGTDDGEAVTLSDEPVAVGETLRIGMINMENSPLISAPEVRLAAEAAVQYVNDELDGVDGVPIELVTCVVSSAEDAQSCAQQMASDDTLVSVINGVNAFNGFFDFYGTMGGTPVVGGVPLFPPDFQAPTARYFFGGSLSAFTGIARFVVEDLGAQTVGVLYGDNAAGTASKQALAQVFEIAGTEVTEVPVPSDASDVVPQVTQVANGLDAVVVVTDATECGPVMNATELLGIAKETVVYTGTCNDEESLSEGGDAAVGSWMHFTLYGSDQVNVPEDKVAETELTTQIYDTYAPDIPTGGLAVLGINAVLNLHDLYEEIGTDALSPATIISTMDDGTPRSSHSGTDWVCGTNPAFPSVCNADNFFAPITADFMYEIGDAVDGLAYLAEAAAAAG